MQQDFYILRHKINDCDLDDKDFLFSQNGSFYALFDDRHFSFHLNYFGHDFVDYFKLSLLFTS